MADDIYDSAPDFSGSGPVAYVPNTDVSGGAGADLLAAEEAWLMSIPGVISVGLGYDPVGSEAIVIGVIDAGTAAQLPRDIQGLPVVVTVTGEVLAQPQR